MNFAGAGLWFRDKAFELLVVGVCAVTLTWAMQTFVSAHAYAADQKTLLKAIQEIAPALSRQSKIDRIQREIKDADQLRQRLIRYRDADPGSPLATARQQEIDALVDLKANLQIELEVAMSASKS